MFGLGPWELVIILVLVIFFYGGRRLPQLGDGIGRGIHEFKKAIRGPNSEDSSDKPVAKDQRT